MKKLYLLYAFVFVLLCIAGCKKNDKFIVKSTGTNTGIENGGGTKPPTGVLAAKLSNLKINGAACAYDSTTTAYYYPVPANASLTGYTVSFDTTGAQAIYFDNVKINNNATLNYELTTNQQIVVKAVDKTNTGPTYKLIITGLPMVSLTTNNLIGDDAVSAAFTLINPDYKAQASKLEISSNIMINIRGASSRAYPKKAYAVHTVDASGADADVALLGLRSDNSWILDAMYIDQARMRNRLCTDVWNSFNNVPHIASEPKALNGTRGYMTEVFINNRYAGIYCLTEKLDRKQLQIKKQYGNMYKANFWTTESSFYGVSPYSNTSDTWGGWELEYPELGDTPAPDWGYLYNITNFVATATDAEFIDQIQSKVDINNMVDYFIFINIIEAPDNENKNTFFSFYDSRNASKFFYSVWDLDGSMGRNAGGYMITNNLLKASNNNLLDRLFNLNIGDFKGLLKARWNAIKNNQLSKTTMVNRIEAYRKQLVNTNAYARERLIWGILPQSLDTETNYMESWYGAQYELFDNYINGL